MECQVGAAWQEGSAHLVGSVVFEHDVDATEQLTRDRAHRGAPRLAFIESTLQIGSQIRIRLTGRDRRQPQGSAQVRRATFGHMRLSRAELTRRKDGWVNAGI